MRCTIVTAVLVAAGLCGCGGGSDAAKAPSKAPKDSGTKESSAGTSKAESKKPAESKPAPAKAVMGGDSPADVVKRVKAAADAKDFGAVINLIEPTQRKGMVAMLALMPHLMRMLKPMLGMFAQMGAGMAEGMGADAAEVAKAEAEKKTKEMMADLDKVILEMDAVCKAHQALLPSLEELGIDPMGGKMEPDELAAKVGNRLDKVDGGAFAAAMAKALEKMKKIMPEGQGGDMNPMEAITGKVGAGKLTDLKIEGDTATGMVDGEPAAFLKVDGRWYVKAPEKSGAGAEAGMGGADEGMGDEGGGDEGGGDDGGEDG